MYIPTGLVNYVSSANTTAFDRALPLAESIVKNGLHFPNCYLVFSEECTLIAPLALKAAKQAISRSEDLALETGMSIAGIIFNITLTTP